MGNFLKNVARVATNPQMFAAYVRWVAARLAFGKTPTLLISPNVRIGKWISFSEYYSFQNPISVPERNFIYAIVKQSGRSGVAFDIGANIGIFTCLIASAGCHQIHAFEPIPETFCRLKANVLANRVQSSCILNCMAVGDSVRLLDFEFYYNSPATSKLARESGDVVTGPQNLQRVAATSLDAYCESFGLKTIDFVKVDVEGMEPNILRGARQLLAARAIRAIMIEICPGNLRGLGASAALLFNEIQSVGYSAYNLNGRGEVGEKLTVENMEAISLGNVILLPNS